MRVVGYIDHRTFKITVFSWSEKYIVKIEAGFFEQSYKFPLDNFTSWDDLKMLIDDEFLDKVYKRFKEMNTDTKDAFIRYQNKPRLA